VSQILFLTDLHECACLPTCEDLCHGECGCRDCMDAWGEEIDLTPRMLCEGCGGPWIEGDIACRNPRCCWGLWAGAWKEQQERLEREGWKLEKKRKRVRDQ
jgi:hypothetical protein